ncbi:MAG: replication initiator protein A [Hyphomonadaceae bacterium]|jgi:plasmid replication initiation protein
MSASEQIDLFLDSMIDAPLRDEQATLEHPFFSLTKRPQREPMIYDHGAISIQVSPGPRGIATIWDRDVLIYCASILNDRLGRGLPLERKIRFAAHDFLKLTGRGKGLQAYTLFLDALERLNTTSVKTTIAAGDSTERRGFTWISAWRVIEDTRPDGTRRMRGVEVELCDWMYRAIVQDRRVLSINPQYFRLHSGLARRLYQLARKHCGRQPNWSIGLVRLAEKVGTAQDLRFFKRDLKAIIAKDGVPDYTFTMTRDPNGELEAAMAEQGIDMSDLKNDRILVVVTPKFETSNQGDGKPIGIGKPKRVRKAKADIED